MRGPLRSIFQTLVLKGVLKGVGIGLLEFANDLLIFFHASQANARKINQVLDQSEKKEGQEIKLPTIVW